MKLFDWLKKRLAGESPVKPGSGKLCCSECHGQIHRHDRYVILAARHRDCGDPKMVGQRRLTLVDRTIDGEHVRIAPAASMGAELLGLEREILP
jgi:hypothetical protein